jgi:protoporphyrinogen oxidase
VTLPNKQRKIAVIAGAGPAGLTAALELLRRSDITPIIFEADSQVGGISKTINYRGNRMDLGGHRFFSKSEWVMRWWQEILPIAHNEVETDTQLRIAYQNQSRTLTPTILAPSDADAVMLVRQRMSRIFYRRRFFDYPLKLNAATLRNIGLLETLRIGMSYSLSRVVHRSPELSLEDFFINRFGGRLYRTFFKDYTEKVWGVPCREISAEWGAQRIKGLSVSKALAHALLGPLRSATDTAQKRTETSLIERFLYPKFGPGQMWETVAEQVKEGGGQVLTSWGVEKIVTEGDRVTGIEAVNGKTGERRLFQGDYFFSTMPMKELIRSLDVEVPAAVKAVSEGLIYRDFITVGLLLNKLKIKEEDGSLVQDNWIYIQEPDVLVGRLQIFNNWSPYLVADQSKVWVGLEYFCYDTDELWKLSDEKMIELAKMELEKIGIIDQKDAIDAVVIRVPKTYPAYFGSYDRFDLLREHIDIYSNLFLVGRNGMHKYNNQDHSMLTAMISVDNIIAGRTDKRNIWDVNTEDDYHEAKEVPAKEEALQETA